MHIPRVAAVLAVMLVACSGDDSEAPADARSMERPIWPELGPDLAADLRADAAGCDPAQLVNQVDPSRMAQDLVWLTDQPDRTTHQGQTQVASYLKAELAKIGGVTVSEQSYPYSGEQYVNLVVDIPGTALADHYVLAGAHYDAAASSPGADDNASGTAAVLEAARVLAACPGKRSIRLIFFSNGHYVGSTAYVAQLKTEVPPERMDGFLNVDMVGFGPADEDLDLATRQEHQELATTVKAVIDQAKVVATSTFIGNHCG